MLIISTLTGLYNTFNYTEVAITVAENVMDRRADLVSFSVWSGEPSCSGTGIGDDGSLFRSFTVFDEFVTGL